MNSKKETIQNTTSTRQFIPYSSLLTVRLDYDYNDRDSTLWLLLKQGIQYSYCFKNTGEAEHVYTKLLEKL